MDGARDHEQRYQRAIALHRGGHLDEAATLYREVLSVEPTHAGALHLLGVVEAQCERYEDAASLIEQAVAIEPGLAAAHANLGNVWIALGLLTKALVSYDRALALQPGDKQSLMGTGKAYRLLGQQADALEAYDAALRIDPACGESLMCRGDILLEVGRTAEGIASLRSAVECGADAEAIGFVLASIGAESRPRQAPAGYLRELFDGYAERFDAALVERLGYRTPELLMQLVLREPQLETPVVLDLGCGTGLCGPLLRPIAQRLIGVDLSPGMIAKARERGVYDELECIELTEYLTGRFEEFDLIVAADVFVYIGDLEPVLTGARRALRPNGRLVFSVEMSDQQDCELARTRRYRHSGPYLEQVAARTGFRVTSIEIRVLRTNDGHDVRGLLTSCSPRSC